MIAFLSNAKLQFLQYWTVSPKTLIVVIHHEFWWLFGQGSVINRNSQFPLNVANVLASADCLRYTDIRSVVAVCSTSHLVSVGICGCVRGRFNR